MTLMIVNLNTYQTASWNASICYLKEEESNKTNNCNAISFLFFLREVTAYYPGKASHFSHLLLIEGLKVERKGPLTIGIIVHKQHRGE